ncbi:hypothetical protein Ciccas_000975 [Cichlidogyrus casuarinus]|uniref:Uncharacterized protein n=1 Tax=Cichlidogyrus casuarinus TaxID=1844966 RepID=A0ABD2QLB7_9PLAT
MTEAMEAPVPPDGYCLSLAILSALEFVWAMKHQILDCTDSDRPLSCERSFVGEPITSIGFSPPSKILPSEDMAALNRKLMENSWSGLLAVLSILYDASACDMANEYFLLALTGMAALCGHLQLDVEREAFVTLLCRSALPSNYYTTFTKTMCKLHPGLSQPSAASGYASASTLEESYERSTIAMVISLSTQSGPDPISAKQTSTAVASTSQTLNSMNLSAQNALVITGKHIQAARALLQLAHSNGNQIGTSWNLVLSTLQHVAWIYGLDLAPSQNLMISPASMLSGAGVPLGNSCSDSRMTKLKNTSSPLIDLSNGNGPQPSIYTQTIASEKPTLTSMLSRIFTHSLTLEEASFESLVLALIDLAKEAAEFGVTNSELNAFAISKLAETGLSNISRLDLFWDKMYGQLLSISKLPVPSLRVLSADALVVLIKQAIALYCSKKEASFWDDTSTSANILRPLCELSNVVFDDVRDIQLHCVEHVLQCYGDKISSCWLLIIKVIAAICSNSSNSDWSPGGVPVQGEHTVLKAFNCFKLIVNDYLPSLGPECYNACIATATRFACHTNDLNISLSAVECIVILLISSITTFLASDSGSETKSFLWLQVYQDLAFLCLDSRHTIRKSAGHTLFNSIDCHANLFEKNVWKDLFDKVMFPLLLHLSQKWLSCLDAESEQDSESKLWAETVVLAMSGISRIFVGNRKKLLELSLFDEAWKQVLEFIEKNAALTKSLEISLNSLTCLQIMLLAPDCQTLVSGLEDATIAGRSPIDVYQMTNQVMLDGVDLPGEETSKEVVNKIWLPAWNSWIKIAKNNLSILDLPQDGHGKDISSVPFMSLLLDLLVLFMHRIPSTVENVSAFDQNVAPLLLNSVVLPCVRQGVNNNHIFTQGKFSKKYFFDDLSYRPLTGALSRCLGILIKKNSEHLLSSLTNLLCQISDYSLHLPPLRTGLCYALDSSYQDIVSTLPLLRT